MGQVTVLKEHTSGTPLENSGTPWGVRYTRLTSTDLNPEIDCRDTQGALEINTGFPTGSASNSHKLHKDLLQNISWSKRKLHTRIVFYVW